jgi:Na+-translocating ferredoxin:NAD+ oxidoreductase RnfD subunit
VSTSSALRRFFSTPKGLLIIILVILTVLAAPHEGLLLVLPGLTAGVLTAGLIDGLILRKRESAWTFPDGAVLTGLFIAMVLSAYQPWYVFACGSAIAVCTKYVFRTRFANVFNPAALALVACYYIFDAPQNWWGALPELPPVAIVVLFATGAFITDRVNKMPLALTFLGLYYALFTATAFIGDSERVAEIFRAPDLHAVLFFAFFILTDPPTSPTKYADQILCGVIVALSSYFLFEVIGAVYYLLAGVLVGNVWEAWRRWHVFSRRRTGDPEASPVRP